MVAVESPEIIGIVIVICFDRVWVKISVTFTPTTFKIIHDGTPEYFYLKLSYVYKQITNLQKDTIGIIEFLDI